MSFKENLKEKFKYMGKSYKNEEEKKAYTGEYKKRRLGELKIKAGKDAKFVTHKTSNFGAGFGQFAQMGANVNRNLSREGFGFSPKAYTPYSPWSGGSAPKKASPRKPRYKWVRKRI